MAAMREITIPVRLDANTFKRFARFDAFAVKKRWVRPALFSGLLIAFAALALLMKREESGLIAAVLLAVGLGLPIVYIGTFLRQVNAQAVRSRLTQPRLVYTVTLTEAGISVQNHQRSEDQLRVGWENVWRAFYRQDCVYLYVSPKRAFLLPAGQADATNEALWKFLIDKLGESRCYGSKPVDIC